jgi:uncharacterized protein YjfI (DUF2170 family)
MKRKEFIAEFLGALGAESIEWREENDRLISGVAIYDKSDPEEIQEFCWHTSESKVPSMNVLNLAKLLNVKKLLNIDKISVTRAELRGQYNEMFGANVSESEFSEILNELEKIEVPMIDEGKETDAYFIHE